MLFFIIIFTIIFATNKQFSSAKFLTVFFQIHALGVYKIFMILGGESLFERGINKRGRLFKRNTVLAIGSFLFSMILKYNLIFMRTSSESLEVIKLLFVFTSYVLLAVISKGPPLRYSAFDSRFCCSFNISTPLAQV